jgi:hypothetical protein
VAEKKELLCASGKHSWLDPEDRKRCCNGYVRVQDYERTMLERMGAEHIVLRQLFRGWLKSQAAKYE